MMRLLRPLSKLSVIPAQLAGIAVPRTAIAASGGRGDLLNGIQLVFGSREGAKTRRKGRSWTPAYAGVTKLSVAAISLLMSSAPVHAQVNTLPAAPAYASAPVLPGVRVLTDEQRAGYASVFAAIRGSDWIGAQAELEKLGDGPLHSIARAELYLAKGSPKVPLEPLLDLLARAPDMPEAAQLARLAATRSAGAELQRLVWQDGQPRRTRVPGTRKDMLGADFETQVQPLLRDNQPAAAEALLIDQQWLLAPETLTEYQQRIGWTYYTIGDDPSARRMADQARTGSGDWTLMGEWLAGLSSWRMRDCASAGRSFATVAARAGDWELAAAGHYWASRADMMCGHPEWVQARLRNAARYTETFYGMLAQSALGIRTGAAQLHNFHDAEWRAGGNLRLRRHGQSAPETSRHGRTPD